MRERQTDRQTEKQKERERGSRSIFGEQVERERVLLGYARGDIDEVLVCVGVCGCGCVSVVVCGVGVWVWVWVWVVKRAL